MLVEDAARLHHFAGINVLRPMDDGSNEAAGEAFAIADDGGKRAGRELADEADAFQDIVKLIEVEVEVADDVV